MVLNISHFGKHQISLIICMPTFPDLGHLDVLSFGFLGVVELTYLEDYRVEGLKYNSIE